MTAEWLVALAAAAAAGVAVLGGLVWWAGRRPARFRRLVRLATALTFCLVVVGAYVRLSDAGLGCPDWPGCYGHPQVSAAAAAGAGGTDVPDVAKGWKEMGHRYLASLVGLLIAAIVIIAVRARRQLGQSPSLVMALLGILFLQAALGRWTVTLLLKPAIVSMHLAGGMTTFALLLWLSLRQGDSRTDGATPLSGNEPLPPAGNAAVAALRPYAAIALGLVAGQILLGGWVSSNYAALACPDLPLCRGAWLPAMDLSNAFHLVRELGRTGDGALLSNEALTGIHWVHRVGAAVVVGFCTLLGIALARERPTARLGALLLLAAWGQAGLGMANVMLGLPLALAAAHNAGAALLLAVTVMLNFRCAMAAATLRSASAVLRAASIVAAGDARGSR